tara:strand:+ start:222 stop:422 length:201 start_codon:yes stop_codon:yes gene_type:complete
MTNKLLESLRKKLDKTLDNINEKSKILKKLKQNNKIIIDKDIKDNIPNHLKGLSEQQIKGLKKLYK